MADPALPSPNSPAAEDPAAYILAQQQRATVGVLGSLEDDPEKAARSLELQDSTGTPASLIYGVKGEGVDRFEVQHKAALTASLLKNNQFLAQYANSNPMAAKVSNDDWGQLDAVSGALQKLGQVSSFLYPTFSKQGQSTLAAAGKGFLEGLETPGPAGTEAARAGYGRLPSAIAGVLDFPGQVFSGVLEAVRQGTEAAQVGAGLDPNAAAQRSRELTAMLEAELMRTSGREAMISPEIEGAVRSARPFIDQGIEPPVGLHPAIDKLHADQAKNDLRSLDELYGEAQKSATRERSPDLFANFIRQHTNASIGIDAEAVRKLYGDKVPEAGDNLLGWIPGLQDQLDLAEATHGDVEVPLADWVAKADPEVAKELHDFIRVRPGGMTLEEAGEPRATQVEEGAKAEGEETMPAPEITPVDALRQSSKLEPVFQPEAQPTLTGAPARNVMDSVIVPEKVTTGAAVTYKGAKAPSYASFSLRDSLGVIPKDSTDPISKVLTKLISDKLAEHVGDTPIHVLSLEGMQKIAKEIGWDFTPAGFYTTQGHYIAVLKDVAEGRYGKEEAIRTVLHEGSHAFTQDAIEKNPVLEQAIAAVQKEVLAAMPEDTARGAYFKSAYLEHNVHEFTAGFHSDPGFQTLLRQTEISPELRQALHLSRDVKSHWDAIREIIKRIWQKVLGERPTDSALDAMLHISDIIEQIRKGGKEPLGEEAHATGIKEPELPEAGTTRLEDRKIFKTPGAMGLTKAQYARYQELIAARSARDAEIHQQAAEALERKRQTQEWKDNEKRIRDEVRTDIAGRPDIAADRFLREGDLYGERVRRPKLDRGAIPTEVRGRVPSDYLGDGGIHPDDVAGLFGYQSGDHLLESLGRLKEEREAAGLTPKAHIDAMIAAETDRRMRREHGDLEGNILTEAKEHVVDQTQLDLLHEETLLAASKAGQEFSFTKAQVAQWVKDHFNSTKMGLLSSDKYLAAAGRAGTKAENALLEDNPAEAFRAKQQQYMAVLSAKLAVKVEKEKAGFDRLAKRYSKREVAGTPAEYTNWVHDILIRTGNSVRRSIQDLQDAIGRETHGTLQEFVAGKNHDSAIWDADENMPSDFQVMPVAPFLFDQAYRKPVEEMNVDEFRAVHNSLKTIIKNGRDERSVMVSGEKADLAETVGKMADQLGALFAGKEKQYAFGHKDQGIGHTLRTYWASLLQIESIFNRFDRGDPKGIFKKVITEPIFEGSNGLNTLEREFSRKYREIGGFGSKAELKRKVDNPLFRDPLYDGELKQMTRGNLLTVLQNVGNAQQLDKLARGYGIKDQNAIMQWLFANTKKEDWDRAQKLGDLFGEAFEESARMYHNLSGVAPEKIDLQPIQTPFGEYKGWYHPIVYDPIRPGSSKKLMGPNPLEDGSYFRAATPSGYTKRRTGYAAPIQLNLDAIPWKLRQMLNDAAMRPAVTDAAKVFYHPKFQMAITKGYGKEIKDLMIPYLKDIAGQKQFKDAAQSTALRVLEKARQNVIATLIGLNPSTVMKHGPTAAMLSIKEVGAANFLRELTSLASMNDELGERNWSFAMNGGMVDGQRWNGSEELQRRQRNWQETLTGTQADLFGDNTLRNNVIKFGATPVALSDLLSAVPTWLASYKERIREGDQHGQAVESADRAVRRAHGSSAVAARPRIMRGGPLAQLATPFYTFFNEMFQRQYEMAWRAKDTLRGKSRSVEEQGLYEGGKAEVKNALGGMWAYVIFPALVEQMVSPVLTGNQSTTEKIAGWGLRTVASSLPGVRDLAEAFIGDRDPTIGLYSTSGKMLYDMGRDASRGRMTFDRAHAGTMIKHYITGIGAMSGLTNAQEGRTAEYVWNYATGVEHPRSLGDVMKGLWHGTQREQRR